MSNYTPGPWRLDDPLHANVLATDYHVIDAGQGFHRYGGRGFSVAGIMSIDDARLINAAPDLLALAQQYASECSECGGTGTVHVKQHHGGIEVDGERDCEDCADIRAVIAKATA